MNEDIKSMIKSRRDQRYHGSAYGDGQMNKAITDHKEELLPILNKFRNKQPLTPEEKALVEQIASNENKKVERQDYGDYLKPAYDDGVDYANGSLDAGVYPDELRRENERRYEELRTKTKEQKQSHSRGLNPESPAGKLQGAIRNAADHMGTEPRALAADKLKLFGAMEGETMRRDPERDYSY